MVAAAGRPIRPAPTARPLRSRGRWSRPGAAAEGAERVLDRALGIALLDPLVELLVERGAVARGALQRLLELLAVALIGDGERLLRRRIAGVDTPGDVEVVGERRVVVDSLAVFGSDLARLRRILGRGQGGAGITAGESGAEEQVVQPSRRPDECYRSAPITSASSFSRA